MPIETNRRGFLGFVAGLMMTAAVSAPAARSLSQSWLLGLQEHLCPSDDLSVGAELGWREWLAKHFPEVCWAPFSNRHIQYWGWVDDLEPSKPVRAAVHIWPRNSGKSTSGELGVVRCGVKLSRRFALYISEAQDQANQHVQSISTWMESLGMERAVNQYGQAKGWKVNLLRTVSGFNVLALGLDAASRGVKLDQYRPDLIIFDDIDNHADTVDTVDKKIHTLTSAILPAGSSDCAILFLQNKIHKNGIVAQLADGRADFLHNRAPVIEEPAVIGLQTAIEVMDDGANVYRVTAGTATWEGQSLAVCEKQINDWGLKAFRREAQHEVEDADGIFFRVNEIRVVKPADVPPMVEVCLAWDFAATDGGGDWTVGFLLGRAADSKFYILSVIRGQWSSERVRQVVGMACAHYLPDHKRYTLRFPQDPGQAGKDQADQLVARFSQWNVKRKPVSGSKWDRATSFAEAVNLGNVSVVEADLPVQFASFVESVAFWHWWPRVAEVYRNFRADVRDQHDDDVDAGADSYNQLAVKWQWDDWV